MERMKMFNPPHPGGFLKRNYLDEVGVKVNDFADHIGRDRKTVSRILNEKAEITPDMAERIAKATNTTAQSWLVMQAAYNLYWQEKEHAAEYAEITVMPVFNGMAA